MKEKKNSLVLHYPDIFLSRAPILLWSQYPTPLLSVTDKSDKFSDEEKVEAEDLDI